MNRGQIESRRPRWAGKLRLASQRGPHWADPLKAWGEVLLRQGERKEATKKYNEALKYAPNWAAF